MPIGATEIFPLTLYSRKRKSVAEIPKGGQITLSNNPANQVRPLLDLAAAGLIVLKDVFAARAEDKDNPRLLALAQLYHDPEVEAAVRAESGYQGIFKTNDPAELQATLAELQTKFRK
ncbi:MetQ/NlpA family ABC transporter substrate-binding protein [Nocardia sp. NPDC004278]